MPCLCVQLNNRWRSFPRTRSNWRSGSWSIYSNYLIIRRSRSKVWRLQCPSAIMPCNLSRRTLKVAKIMGPGSTLHRDSVTLAKVAYPFSCRCAALLWTNGKYERCQIICSIGQWIDSLVNNLAYSFSLTFHVKFFLMFIKQVWRSRFFDVLMILASSKPGSSYS